MDSAARAAAYRDMIDLLNHRHIQGALSDSDGGVCLVGAADRVTGHRLDSQALQAEILEEILTRSPLLRAVNSASAAATTLHRSEFPLMRRLAEKLPIPSLEKLHGPSTDGGLAAVEMWNDTPWRRTSAVVAVLTDLANKHAAEARDELIAELTATVAQLRRDKALLTARISELEATVEALTAENTFLRGLMRRREAKISAQELRAANTDLADIEAHLCQVLAEVEATAAPAAYR